MNGMIPGSTPYTEDERRRLEQLVSQACDAQDAFPLDELEGNAARIRAIVNYVLNQARPVWPQSVDDVRLAAQLAVREGLHEDESECRALLNVARVRAIVDYAFGREDRPVWRDFGPVDRPVWPESIDDVRKAAELAVRERLHRDGKHCQAVLNDARKDTHDPRAYRRGYALLTTGEQDAQVILNYAFGWSKIEVHAHTAGAARWAAYRATQELGLIPQESYHAFRDFLLAHTSAPAGYATSFLSEDEARKEARP